MQNVLEDNCQQYTFVFLTGFEKVGVKKDGSIPTATFKNEILFQKINN